MCSNTPSCLLFAVILFWHCSTHAAVRFWECTVIDTQGQRWTNEHTYRPPALYHAMEACKRESKAPQSCKNTALGCELFINGRSTRPLWQCTAIDGKGASWKNKGTHSRMDAALNAKAACQQLSAIPSSCYVHTLTCHNVNALE